LDLLVPLASLDPPALRERSVPLVLLVHLDLREEEESLV